MEQVDPNRLWYVFTEGKEIGPLKEVEIRHRILTKNIEPSSHAYTEGMVDWRSLRDISIFSELFEDKNTEPLGEQNLTEAFDKIPFSSKQKRKSDLARNLLVASTAIFIAATVYYFWNPSENESKKIVVAPIATEYPVATNDEDPFAKRDWAELRNYRNRTDIVGSGFVVARDRIDEDFPVLKGAVSTNINANEIDYRIYPVPGAHLMALPKVLQGKTSIVNGYFVLGPLSDDGKALPAGKYRLIARADQVYLGEVTLVRGHLPEGEELQKEEEKLKAARFEKITELKGVFAKKIEGFESLMKDFQKLKAGAINPGSTNPATFSADARLALEKLRDERTAIKNSEGDLILLGSAGLDVIQVVEGIWAPMASAFEEFPTPDPQHFINFDAKSVEQYLAKVKQKIQKVPSEEIATRSESLLNEETIKKSLMTEESAAR